MKHERVQIEIGHCVDATKLESLDFENFSEVTFCHPHIGSENLQRNSSLVAHFLHSCRSKFPEALIQVTLLDG